VLDESLAPLGAAPAVRGGMAADDEVLSRPDKAEALLALLGRVSLRASPPASPRPQTPVAARASR
jgi:hypothetical protein